MNIIEQIKALPEETAPMTSIYPEVIRVTVEDLKALAESHARLLPIARAWIDMQMQMTGSCPVELCDVVEQAEKL